MMSTEPRSRWIRLLALFAHETPPTGLWLRDGTLRPLLIALIALVPFALAGAVACLTGVEVRLSLALASLAVLVSAAPLWRSLTARQPGQMGQLAVGTLSIAVVAGFSVYALYNRYFGGLTNFRGTDPGFHVNFLHSFISGDYTVYQGFVATYSALYFIGRILHCNDFWAFCVLFYAEVALVCAIPLMVTFSTLSPLRRTSPLAYSIGVALAPMTALAAQYFVILPQQHQYQADGFFPQLFGLVPLFAIWLIDTLVRPIPLRIAYLLLTFVLFRFTYGLNLVDLALALATLLVLEAFDRRVRHWFRVLLVAGAVVLVEVAHRVAVALVALRWQPGHFLAYDVSLANDATAYALAFLLLVIAGAAGRRGLFSGGGLGRAARFPLLFGAASLSVLLYYLHLFPVRRYYYFKYPMYSLVLAAAACGALAPAVIARGIAELRRRGWRRVLTPLTAVGAVALAAVAGQKWYAATLPHREGFLERAWAKPPYWDELNLPLADLHAWSRIEQTLRREQKKFRGYIVSQFGMMMFMNAAFDVPGFGWGTWFGPPGPSTPIPGTCVFWDEGPSNYWWVWESQFPLASVRRHLSSDPAKECVSYRPHWDPRGPLRILCHLCY